jgi:hypothetical protein
MLRIELQETEKPVTMRIEGRFAGKYAEDARGVIANYHATILTGFIVNVSEVVFVDATGEAVLSWLARMGGRFVSDNSYSLNVCKRLRLPMARKLRR